MPSENKCTTLSLMYGIVVVGDRRLGGGIGELLKPERDVLHNGIVGTFAVRKDALSVVLSLRSVDADADREMVAVLAI